MKYFLLLSVTAVFFFNGCLQREMPTEPTRNPSPSINMYQVPDQITFNQMYRISVQVTDKQGVDDVPLVEFSIIQENSTTPLHVDTLWDDGQTLHSMNGDVIAHDGIFTQLLYWTPEDTSRQELAFIFEATDKSGNESTPVEKAVISLLNVSPQLTEVAAPTLLPSGFEGEKLITATVIDENAVTVHYNGTRNERDNFEGQLSFEGELFDNGGNGDIVPQDNVFSLAITSEFAAGKQGLYTVNFQAEDAFGIMSEAITQELDIENEAPNISNLNCPNGATRPSTGTTDILITLDVSDAQGLGDIKSVSFMSLKPDSTYANSGQPIPLVDNGLHFDKNRWQQKYFGDKVASDGIYTITTWVSPGDLQGDYVWTFQAEDWVGNLSDTITKVFSLQ